MNLLLQIIYYSKLENVKLVYCLDALDVHRGNAAAVLDTIPATRDWVED